MKTQPYKGRTVLITGASAGIGRAAAKRYAAAGADVVQTARRLAELEDAAREVTSLGVRVLPVRVGYCASKAAVNAMTELLRAELAADASQPKKDA